MNLLTDALIAGLDIAIIGAEKSGKTTLAKSLAPNAPLINRYELTSEHLHTIKALLIDTKLVICENLDQRALAFIKPIIETKSVLGATIPTQFIITTVDEVPLKTVVQFGLNAPSKSSWIEWAKSASIHKSVISIVESDDEFFDKYGVEKLSIISQILYSKAQNKEELVALIGAPIVIEKVAAIEPVENSELLSEIKNGEMPKNELLLKLKNEDKSSWVKLLAQSVSSPKALSFIDLAIRDVEIQNAIDQALLDLL